MDALAWQQIENGLCSGCKGDLAETTDPDNEDTYEGHVLRCHKCAARERAVKEFSSQDGSSDVGLLTYTTGGPDVTTS